MFENKRDSVSDETRADTYYTGLITAGTLSPAELDRYNELAYSVCLLVRTCLLYTSDAADDTLRVDLGGRRII